MSAETAAERLPRLLTLVPYLLARPGIAVATAAEELGITEAQLHDDLNLIWMCGYGQLHDEMIDVDAEGDRITISNAETIRRPLRLGVDEALTLIVGLRALASVPGLHDTDAIERALSKLMTAAGTAGEAASRVRVGIDDDAEPSVLAEVRRALSTGRRVHLRYLVPSRDETTERDVDPMQLVNLDSKWYLEGWCHRADAVRLFRLDRIEHLDILEVEGAPPERARSRDLAEGAYRAAPDAELVTLRLAPSATWVSDYYPVESVVDEADGGQVITLRTSDSRWLIRLVLRLGGRARVVEPTDLADTVLRSARAARAAYQDGS